MCCNPTVTRARAKVTTSTHVKPCEKSLHIPKKKTMKNQLQWLFRWTWHVKLNQQCCQLAKISLAFILAMSRNWTAFHNWKTIFVNLTTWNLCSFVSSLNQLLNLMELKLCQNLRSKCCRFVFFFVLLCHFHFLAIFGVKLTKFTKNGLQLNLLLVLFWKFNFNKLWNQQREDRDLCRNQKKESELNG